ncbi:hypothetical protein MLP_52410 [Microlunatus phosphovorus NM-1]|uniref:Uncharacterized protein n=1 Tax=Microlunatus phosphovorus (strain ATCC 700054 / DSM 10555 / JCM 9379 / NBRC 101784 / NCIMB 13414 / VKM Ac-1990 / NM-1) TaxID=1032480 RepID=F5XIL7_MICPN|nr:hypothetical protein MLP_52410 [Microlunatus phosphovorus NM-1]
MRPGGSTVVGRRLLDHRGPPWRKRGGWELLDQVARSMVQIPPLDNKLSDPMLSVHDDG